MRLSRLAIIPARGGSKRIPNKNIKSFVGKPIITYSIEAALHSGLFDKVMVSTDSENISDIAKRSGAEVPFMRSSKNSNDYATTADVILEVIDEYAKLGFLFEEACCIYATAPFVSSEKLIDAHNVLKQGFDSVFPVLPYGFPIQRAMKIVDATIQMYQPEHMSTRTQDLDKSYHDSGQFYWFTIDRFMLDQKLYTDNSSAIILNEMEAHDIDTPEDWEVAEFKYKFLHSNA